jgi:RNA polymerase sigma-70 factor (ECF subfamily)
MAALQRGDREAARDLLAAARTVATVQAGRILRQSGVRDANLTEDVVQETLLAIYEKRHTYDPAQPFVPWLNAITRYKAVDLMRRAKWRRTEALDVDRSEQAAPHADPDVAIELERLLATLPLRARRAVELVKIQGFTHAEVALQMGVGESALKVLVHRALKRLRGAP